MLIHMRLVILVVSLLGTVLWEAAVVDADERPVMPIVLREESLPKIIPMQDRLYQIIQRQARYLLTLVHPWEKDARFSLMTKHVSGEHGIRPNAGTVKGFAFLYRFGPYDERIVGCDRQKLLNKTILPMMGYLVATHRTGDQVTDDGKPWGDHWQSAHWATLLGVTAWWIWDDLPGDLRAGVRRVVAHEADRFVHAKPPHRLRRDTKAEENAWNSQILAIAVVLMPDDPRRPGWERAFQKWALSSFLRPADEHSSKIVDGRPVAEQFTGANVFDDYTLENHGFVHPDYMTAYSLSLGCALYYDLTGRPVPESLLHNIPGIYENLKWFSLPDGGFVYPNGQDWELFQSPVWCDKHMLLGVYDKDPDSWQLTNALLNTTEKMQQRHPSGMIYGYDENFFPSLRTDVFYSLCLTWLLLQQADAIYDDPHPPLGVRRLDSAKIVLHRTQTTINTFSWGARVMVRYVPRRLDRVTSPYERSGIGHIRIAGRRRPLPIHLDSADVKADKNSFTADAVVIHGDNLIRAELHIESHPEGTLRLQERLVAAADVTTTEIGTGLLGVLNNHHWVYEHGQRHWVFDKDDVTVPALSGKTFEKSGVKEITVDSVFRVQSQQPLNIQYVGARAVDRGRATDVLYLNHVPGKHEWHAGQVISEYRVEIGRADE